MSYKTGSVSEREISVAGKERPQFSRSGKEEENRTAKQALDKAASQSTHEKVWVLFKIPWTKTPDSGWLRGCYLGRDARVRDILCVATQGSPILAQDARLCHNGASVLHACPLTAAEQGVVFDVVGRLRGGSPDLLDLDTAFEVLLSLHEGALGRNWSVRRSTSEATALVDTWDLGPVPPVARLTDHYHEHMTSTVYAPTDTSGAPVGTTPRKLKQLAKISQIAVTNNAAPTGIIMTPIANVSDNMDSFPDEPAENDKRTGCMGSRLAIAAAAGEGAEIYCAPNDGFTLAIEINNVTCSWLTHWPMLKIASHTQKL